MAGMNELCMRSPTARRTGTPERTIDPFKESVNFVGDDGAENENVAPKGIDPKGVR